MKKLFPLLQFVAQCITLGLAFAFIVSLFAPHLVDRLRGSLGSGGTSANSASTAASASTPIGFGPANSDSSTETAALKPRTTEVVTSSYASAVQRAAPAVVSIKVNKVESKLVQQMIRPADPRLAEAIGAIPIGQPQYRDIPTPGLGSGVIFNSNGYVLTNYHVIKGATDINAVYQDGRTTNAKLIGSDEETDLAVLHLDAFNTPTIDIAEKEPAVGDVVLAIGSPFGLDKTVTMGIVSAIGRVNPATGEEFIQTDAAINSGNSGGALINAFGELVGINSNNYAASKDGGNVGIGFAIPVSMAKKVLDQITRYGRVIRAWMGASYKDLPPQQNDPMQVVTNGATITDLEPDGPAAKAGLKLGDIVTQFDGKWVPNQFALHNRESHMAPGSKVGVTVIRSGSLHKFDVVLEEKPAAANTQANTKQ